MVTVPNARSTLPRPRVNRPGREKSARIFAGHHLLQVRGGEVRAVVDVERLRMPHTCQPGQGLRQIACRNASAVVSADGAPRLTAYPATAREW